MSSQMMKLVFNIRNAAYIAAVVIFMFSFFTKAHAYGLWPCDWLPHPHIPDPSNPNDGKLADKDKDSGQERDHYGPPEK